ncbi:lysylphosphatidylglycerol synthase domain-containing protein [Roseiarcaceae bacterium H3SJ34-1]|nr:lysylphosphatidylglycerol synthase domain-containing protein [Roseiarcaceae bacterium H3SJ34-1]
MLRASLVLVAALAGVGLIAHSLRQYDPAQLTDAIERFQSTRMSAAIGFAAGSYFCLTFFDYLGLRYAGCGLPWRKAALASFTSLSFGHNIGFSALSAGVLRYRFYARWGASAEQVVKVIFVSATTVAVGLATLAGLAALANPAAGQLPLGAPIPAFVFFAVPVGYVAACLLLRRCYVYKGVTLQLPPLDIACLQVFVGTMNFICVAACMQQCLLAVREVSFTQVAAAYVAGNVATIVTHVPGGLGVLETVIQFVVGKQGLIIPLLMFRLIYFIIPLVLGSALLIGSEAYFKSRSARV